MRKINLNLALVGLQAVNRILIVGLVFRKIVFLRFLLNVRIELDMFGKFCFFLLFDYATMIIFVFSRFSIMETMKNQTLITWIESLGSFLGINSVLSFWSSIFELFIFTVWLKISCKLLCFYAYFLAILYF